MMLEQGLDLSDSLTALASAMFGDAGAEPDERGNRAPDAADGAVEDEVPSAA